MNNFLPQIYSESELSAIVQHSGEDDYSDAKGPMTWDCGEASAGLAKDIAAFANSRDGGFIVIGKEESQPGIFKLTGLSESAAKSFDTTKVANWINSRFSPAIHLACYQVEVNKARFVVIRIDEFADIPTICTKRFDDPKDPRKLLLDDGRLYVRSPGAQSKPLKTEGELRELIGLATKKQADVLLQHFNAMLKGNALPQRKPNDQDQTDAELKEIQDTLAARGTIDLKNGWTFCFHPVQYEKQRWADLQDLEKHIRSRSVRITDAFPAFVTGTFRTDWGIANDSYGEAWGLSRSGLFFCHVPFREDAEYSLEHIRNYVRANVRNRDAWKTEQFLESLDTFRWIEFQWNMMIVIKLFAFMSRFIDLFDPGARLTYRLEATPLGNRHLVSLNPQLWFEPLYQDPCGSLRFSCSETEQTGDLLATWEERCVAAMYRFYELFPGYDITQETLRKWLNQYLGKPTQLGASL